MYNCFAKKLIKIYMGLYLIVWIWVWIVVAHLQWFIQDLVVIGTQYGLSNSCCHVWWNYEIWPISKLIMHTTYYFDAC